MKKSLKPKICWGILLFAFLLLFFKWIVPATLRSSNLIFKVAPQAKIWATVKGKPKWHSKLNASTTGQKTSGSSHSCEYEFIVDGKRYVGKHMRLDEYVVVSDGITGFTIPELKERYEKDGTVTVYYNPDDPNQCVLDPNMSPERIFWFIASPIISLIVAALFAYTAYLHLKKPAKSTKD